MAERGKQGPPGVRGTQGEPGISDKMRRAMVTLFLVTFAIGGLNLAWTGYLVHKANEAKCATVVALATVPVPANDITSGAHLFDETTTQIYIQRAKELGCKLP